MSKKNRNTNHINNVFHDIQRLNEKELYELYDITCETNGTVWDPIECKYYNSLQEWAEMFNEYNSFNPQNDNNRSSLKHDWEWDY